MKYLRKFNERLGISSNLEEQADWYIEQIKSNPTKNEFNFIYHDEKDVKYPFKLYVIKRREEEKGTFSLDNGLIIRIADRDDINTLIHELKHLDYYTKKNNCFKDLYHKAQNALLKYTVDSTNTSQQRIKLCAQIFYTYNENEFEARYYGYYKAFDAYLKDKDIKTNSDVLTYFKEFLENNNDKSWNWYYFKQNFNFSIFLPESDINQMFYYYLIDNDKVSFSNNMFVAMYQLIKKDIKRFYKIKFNKYSPDEMSKINQMRRFFEKDIDRKKEKYSRKLFRIVTLMCEKYVK